jgi:hypothetical protein
VDGYDLPYIYSVCAKNVYQCNEDCHMMWRCKCTYGGVRTGWFGVAIFFIYLLELWALKIHLRMFTYVVVVLLISSRCSVSFQIFFFNSCLERNPNTACRPACIYVR